MDIKQAIERMQDLTEHVGEMKNSMKVYISGPMSGIIDYNFPMFEKAQRKNKR